MLLLHFAHHAEAQVFIKEMSFKPLKSDSRYLYHNDSTLLCISGEGISNSLAALSTISNDSITHAINIGVCGGLRDVREDDLLDIQTSYCFNNDKAIFQSFPLKPLGKLKRRDCISVSERVLNDNDAYKLRPLSHCVDMELYGFAKFCHFNKIPASCLKLVSDMAGSQTNCFDVKARAQKLSQKLYDAFTKLKLTQTENKKSYEFEKASFTQNTQINQLIKKLSLKDNLSTQEIIERFKLDQLKSKKQVQDKIEKMHKLLYPTETFVQQKLDDKFSCFHEIGAQVYYDQKLEKLGFEIRFKVNSQTNLDKLKRSIDLFNWKQYKDFMDGDIK